MSGLQQGSVDSAGFSKRLITGDKLIRFAIRTDRGGRMFTLGHQQQSARRRLVEDDRLALQSKPAFVVLADHPQQIELPLLPRVLGASATQDARVAIRADLDRARVSAAAITEEDGTPPPEEAFREAEAFVKLLPPVVPRPSVYASGDAEVGFSWSSGGRFLEVAFSGDGNLHWAATFGEDRPGGCIPIDMRSAARLPKALADLIGRL